MTLKELRWKADTLRLNGASVTTLPQTLDTTVDQLTRVLALVEAARLCRDSQEEAMKGINYVYKGALPTLLEALTDLEKHGDIEPPTGTDTAG